MTDFLYGSRPGSVALLSTELNSLANGNLTAFGPVITPGTTTNLTARAYNGDLIVLVNGAIANTASSYLAVYFVPAIDGTNYPTLSGNNLALPNYFVGNIALYPATPGGAFYEGITGIRIPNVPFKTVLANNAGVALPASGNTLTLYPQDFAY